MKTLSYTESRARYAEVLDSVTNDREEVVITRAGHEPVVIVSLDDFESLLRPYGIVELQRTGRVALPKLDRTV